MAEEIAYLKSELGEIASETRISLMQETFNIRTAPARILCAFEAGKGRVLSNLRLMEMAGSDAGIKTLQVYVCWLRRALGGPETIKSHRGRGYSLTPSGFSKLPPIGAGATSPDAR